MDTTKMQCRVERNKPTLLYSTYTHADTAVGIIKGLLKHPVRAWSN